MTARRKLSLSLACAALLLGGCGGAEPGPLAPETDEPLYEQGQQLRKRERNAEALVSFLKVIEKRGERSAPESHLEAGLIYQQHIKDYIEAIHHFQKYLELRPNSPQAGGVRELINTCKRELWRTMPARPAEEQSVRVAQVEEIEQLRRQNEELRAELAALRGGAQPVARSPRPAGPSSPPAQPAGNPRPAPDDSPLTLAPAPNPAGNRPPANPVPTARPAPSGRTYTVRQSDGLFAIARQFDPVNVSRKMAEIVAANPDVLPQGAGTPLKPGMVLRIP